MDQKRTEVDVFLTPDSRRRARSGKRIGDACGRAGGGTESARGLFADERGTATIEYLIILVCVTIGAAFALIELGPAVVEVFRARVLWLSLPFP